VAGRRSTRFNSVTSELDLARAETAQLRVSLEDTNASLASLTPAVPEDLPLSRQLVKAFLRTEPSKPGLRLTAFEYKALLFQASLDLYDSRVDLAHLNNAWFDDKDVTEHYQSNRKKLQNNALWNFTKERLTTMGGVRRRTASCNFNSSWIWPVSNKAGASFRRCCRRYSPPAASLGRSRNF